MNRGTVRWIALALVAALVAALAVGLVQSRSGSDSPTSPAPTSGGDAAAAGASEAAVDGPHVTLEFCAGVTCPAADQARQQQVQSDVEGDPRVASTRLVSAEQAYQLFLDEHGDNEELVEQVDPETVPAQLEVDLLRADDTEAVVADLQGTDGVASVRDARAPAEEAGEP